MNSKRKEYGGSVQYIFMERIQMKIGHNLLYRDKGQMAPPESRACTGY